VDLALRALSPGVNDPATARACLDRLEQALCRLAGREMPSACRYDDTRTLRVIAPPVTLAHMADVAFAEIARAGRSSVSVMCRLLDAIREIALCVRRADERRALARHAVGIHARSMTAIADERDGALVAHAYRAAMAALRTPDRPAGRSTATPADTLGVHATVASRTPSRSADGARVIKPRDDRPSSLGSG
jgi:uncharacterized membrane protein